MFEGFKLEFIDVGDAVLRVRHGGSRPPVLLLHGHPRTYATWHRVAPLLAVGNTVVCPGSKGSFDLARDVRGFAVKFYTQEGNWDLVGNNIPVFFIQDAIVFGAGKWPSSCNRSERFNRNFSMQIVRTDVSRATALTREPVLRILFCGEGGDCITVDMAGIEAGNDEAALDRSRAILVQTATFGLATNDYDARSNGNFDEIAVTSIGNGNGGIYIFEYRDGEGSRQVPPSTMPSFDAAREEAMLRNRSSGRLGTGHRRVAGWLVRIRDESGNLLCAVDVQEAEAARQTTMNPLAIHSPESLGGLDRVTRPTALIFVLQASRLVSEQKRLPSGVVRTRAKMECSP